MKYKKKDHSKDNSGMQISYDEKEQFVRQSIRPQRKQNVQQFIEKMLAGVLLACVFGTVGAACFHYVQVFLKERYQQQERSDLIASASAEPVEEKLEPEPVDTLNDEDKKGLRAYQQFWTKAAQVGKKCNSYIVAVESSSSAGWYKKDENPELVQSGVIFQQDINHYYIVTATKSISKSDTIQVEMSTGERLHANFICADRNLHLTVLSVEKGKLRDGSDKEIRIAEFSEEEDMDLNAVAITLGAPNGVLRAIVPGIVVSEGMPVETRDVSLDVYSINIAYSEDGGGFVANMDGKLVGILTSDYAEKTGKTNSAFYSISDVKSTIERLTEGKDVPYLGIVGCDVTEECEELPVEEGIYVKDVPIQSPAYQGGIRVADIIVSVDNIPINHMQELRTCLLTYTVGDRIMIKVKRTTGDRTITRNLKITLGKYI